MELRKSINLIIKEFGEEIVSKSKFINLLNDYGAFVNNLPAKQLVKTIVENGLFDDIRGNTSNSQQRVLAFNEIAFKLENSFGFKKELICNILSDIAFGMDFLYFPQHNTSKTKSTCFALDKNGGFYADIDNNHVNPRQIPYNMGLDSNQFYFSFFGSNNEDIEAICFKAFTNRVIFVSFWEEREEIDKEKIYHIVENDEMVGLSDFLFSNLNGYIEKLDEGILKKNLTRDYFTCLFKEDFLGCMIDEERGYKLHFINDILSSYESIDTLSKISKGFKSDAPPLFAEVELLASLLHNDKKDIEREINIQFEAFYYLSAGVKDEHGAEFCKFIGDNVCCNYLLLKLTYDGMINNDKYSLTEENFTFSLCNKYADLGLSDDGNTHFYHIPMHNVIVAFDLEGSFLLSKRIEE